MKKSEARILIWLSQVQPPKRYVTNIANNLDIGYNYVLKALSRMKHKKWLRKERLQTRMFYTLTELGKAQLDEARRKDRE